MAVFDPERGVLIIRVVYDGPGFAGKTTNLTQVTNLFPVQRRSEMYTPGSLKGRTMFFDWLEVEAGKIGGQPFKCQLLTVPGQQQRSHRRHPLLKSADGIVFVCDSSPEGLPESKRSFNQLLVQLRKRDVHVPLLVQANKQDAPGAFTPEQVAVRLELEGTEVPVLPACAASGVGVRETLSYGIKVAVREVQRRIMETGLDAITGLPESADDLFSALLEADEAALDAAEWNG